MNRFQVTVVVKIILISISLIAGIILLGNYKYGMTSLLFFAAALYFIYSLFRFIDKINRDLKRFLTSIKYSDFTQTYLQKNFGAAYRDLYNSVASTYSELSSNRLRAEENLQYLKTLIEQVPSGIISYKENGEVELINNSAKKILNIGDVRNINSIKEERNYLKNLLENLEAGKEKITKFFAGTKEINVSVFATKFKIRNHLYTLITFNDLAGELEKKRLENELNIAQDIQSSLLPRKLPEIKDYEISVLFKPAKRVGGDFYDFFELGKNKLGIIIGDVSGKGLGAAIYTTLIKGIFQTLAFECSSTSELFVKANSLIYNMLDKKSFITAIYAVLDTAENTITFSRAGHEPLIVYENGAGQFKYYKNSGLGLGLDNGNKLADNLDEQVINLKVKDSVLLYTDGLVDMKNSNGVDNAMDNFRNIFSEHYTRDTNSILKEFERHIVQYTDIYEQYDDITVIAVRRNL